ncbi:MAG: tRNA preQ1(34) S-adenosylmethionine ribosyltransferase-isomerase QueA [Kiritimatiellae bacterium]|nr:tRNA preQ1(34) S-adenosylmethionine ribosyltransferase-isomerase QueA [Kiritimatiellia bacterium]
MLTREFDYELPPELIAQEPPPERGASRMLVLHRADGFLEHRAVTDLPEYLNDGDLLVLNDTRVFPARLLGQWADTGGALELLLVRPLARSGAEHWSCIYGSGRPVRAGQRALFAEGLLEAEVTERGAEGNCTVVFRSQAPLMEVLESHGLTPVPPYIRRQGEERQTRLDRERYQTVYARETGAVAAPTAGLHFTEELFNALEKKGVRRTTVTLHVGPGTFKPVKVDLVEEHVMDAERYKVLPETAAAIADCRKRGGRVVAVGSTSVRTLETVAAGNGGTVVAAEGDSSVFIYPPYRFLATDAMLTNFHLPQSTLIMMVSALAGRERIMAAYREAVRERYRFFSYGDCMLIV